MSGSLDIGPPGRILANSYPHGRCTCGAGPGNRPLPSIPLYTLSLRKPCSFKLTSYILYKIYTRNTEDAIQKVLLSLPDRLADRMKAVIPPGQRSKVLADLLEIEVKRREEDLYQCALDVENDQALSEEMKDWDVTAGDGIDDETW